MNSVEFRAKIVDRHIEVPDDVLSKCASLDDVVVTLSMPVQTKTLDSDFIEFLVKHPIKVQDFAPLKRDEVHDRKV